MPTYQVSEDSLSALSALMRHQEQLKQTEVTLSRVRKRQAEEYRAEAQRINKGLATMGLAQEQVSQNHFCI